LLILRVRRAATASYFLFVRIGALGLGAALVVLPVGTALGSIFIFRMNSKRGFEFELISLQNVTPPPPFFCTQKTAREILSRSFQVF
tara:strand:+ start:1687 stop:1947 length:261 start_codon:yes stop_codon:yes gene_type:complete